MTKTNLSRFLCWPAAMLAAALTTAVRADVSIQQKTSLEVASMIRMHGATVTDLTADKKREDTERFAIPPDWTKEVPKPAKGGDDEFTCPKS